MPLKALNNQIHIAINEFVSLNGHNFKENAQQQHIVAIIGLQRTTSFLHLTLKRSFRLVSAVCVHMHVGIALKLQNF